MVTLTLLFLVVGGTLLGAAVGLAAGLVPGLHVNNLAQVSLAFRGPFFAGIAWAVGVGAGASSGETVAPAIGFLFGAALGHAFTDEIPAVFLGAPDPDTALSVLPGHRLLMAGLGREAVRAAALGSALGVAVSLPLVPLLAWTMGAPLHLYGRAGPYLPFILLVVAAALCLSEQGRPSADFSRRRARLLACGVLLASGGLGQLVMFDGLPFPPEPPYGGIWGAGSMHLLSLFAGLFGLPTLLLALTEKPPAAADPPEDGSFAMTRGRTARAAAVGTAAGALVGWLPGVGAAQAAVLATGARGALRRRKGERGPERDSPEDTADFLVMQSAAAAANLLFTLVALFGLQRTRSGTMSAVATIGGTAVEPWDAPLAPPDLLVALLLATALCVPFCYAGALALGRGCVRVYARFSPRRLSATVVGALLLFVVLLEGASGLAVLAAAVPLGLIPPLSGIKRVHLMGAVLVPVALTIAA